MRIDRDNFESIFDVSRETMDRFQRYEVLLTKWNAKINLISRATLLELWNRHFADSAQLAELAPKTTRVWLDFGSGAGFPGMVCAILAKDRGEALKMVLVESDQRKAAFLMTVARELDLDVEVICERVENVTCIQPDVISARAVASLSDLLTYSDRHRQDSTILLFPKGNSYESELTAAEKNWHIDVEVIKSITDSGSVILIIKDIDRVR